MIVLYNNESDSKKRVMNFSEVFVALGGNIGDTQTVLQEALAQIGQLSQVNSLKSSRFYITTPVSEIPQKDYLNAVCAFKTSFSAEELLLALQQIETRLGKIQKAKDAPRIIDLDILFFGLESHATPTLEIPHPKWRERLFVLTPLCDLTTEITVPNSGGGFEKIDLTKLIKEFPNKYNEQINLAQEALAI